VQHPAVREAAVFGIPSDRWGETSLAAVTLHRPGSSVQSRCVTGSMSALTPRINGSARSGAWRIFRRSTAGKTLKRILCEPSGAGRDERMQQFLGWVHWGMDCGARK
jgi:long-chain acyl-CoA synthetase